MTEIQLNSVSPIAFSLCKTGDVVTINLKKARTNEFRAKIGPATDSFLVFKNQTKVGMIPTEITNALGSILFHGKKARIVAMEERNCVIRIQTN
jgi:hypothetical protein